jgi:F-type H+-transporting ATPase subunit delta
MAESRVAIRYAKSFIGLVSGTDGLEAAYSDMGLIDRAVRESRDLRVMLNSPIINGDKKLAVLKTVFKDLSKPTLVFLELLTRKGREGELGDVASSFIAQYKELKGITTAKVVSAAVLTEESRKRILDILTREVGGTVELDMKVNPDLIGGFVLSVGDRQLDTSILSKVNTMRQEMGSNLFIKKF